MIETILDTVQKGHCEIYSLHLDDSSPD